MPNPVIVVVVDDGGNVEAIGDDDKVDMHVIDFYQFSSDACQYSSKAEIEEKIENAKQYIKTLEAHGDRFVRTIRSLNKVLEELKEEGVLLK